MQMMIETPEELMAVGEAVEALVAIYHVSDTTKLIVE